MTYLIFLAAGALLLVTVPALMFGRMVELIVQRATRRPPR